MLQSKIDFLYPIKFDRNPKKRVPTTAPKAKNAPTHPTIEFEIGPSESGVASDMSNGSAGASHPILQPCANATMFASINKCYYYILLII